LRAVPAFLCPDSVGDIEDTLVPVETNVVMKQAMSIFHESRSCGLRRLPLEMGNTGVNGIERFIFLFGLPTLMV
jgi:hypothetical protein